jgi:mRNA-degrading endonuclease HigB of HigAB toxin-antitoxin module
VRRALAQVRKPRFPFIVSERDGWLLVQLASDLREPTSPAVPAADTTLDEKIIEYLRQTEDWDPNGAIASRAQWRTPEDVKASYPKASILKGGRVVFNIKGNDYRLVARIQYQAGVLAVRFFGTHAEYDRIDAETV